VPGYTFHENKDSHHNDITWAPGDAAALGKACDARPDCQAFNTLGFLKNRVLSTSEWNTPVVFALRPPCQGMYVKTVITSEYYQIYLPRVPVLGFGMPVVYGPTHRSDPDGSLHQHPRW
jgi:hypothetical protein